jgi:signal transduction histidine kinase
MVIIAFCPQMQPWAASAKVQIAATLDDFLPHWVLCDKHRLLQVLSNFVSNGKCIVWQLILLL